MSGSNSNKLSKTTVTAMNIESLPDELLFDILARLPAEFLLHISSLVCRKWRRIIHSDGFADAQNIIQQLSSSAYGLVFSPILTSKPRPHSIYATATRGRIETYNLRDKGRATIIGCCNGLALELHDNRVNGKTLIKSLHVMNPLTKKSLLLPSFSFQNMTRVYHKRSGIGYSAASMKYKVTLPYEHVDDDYHVLISLAILTVGVDKSWRRVHVPDLPGDLRDLILGFPLTSEGFLHWGSHGQCLTLNVEIEKFTASAIPNIFYQPCSSSYYDYNYYLSTGRYLSLLVGRAGEFRWDVWEMQSGGGEWRKLEYKIDLEAQKEKLQQFANSYHSTHLLPVGWVKYPETLVFRFPGVIWRNCIFYNLETHEIETINLRRRRGNFKAFVHRNSLHEVV